jgi:hypothetical protein
VLRGLRNDHCLGNALHCVPAGGPALGRRPLRVTGDAALCIEAGILGFAVAGPVGSFVGCVLVTAAFDISAERAKKEMENLGSWNGESWREHHG